MVVHASLVVFAVAIVARAVQIQLVDSTQWARAAESQQVREQAIAAPRGRIFDVNGNVLVETRELMHLAFTPKNLKPVRKRGSKRSDPLMNTRQLVRTGLRANAVPDSMIRRVLDTTRAWVELPQLFLPSEVERFAGLPGITRTRVLKRVVTAPPGIRGVLGTVSDSSTPSGGIEQELDSLLRGERGKRSLISNGHSDLVETPAFERVDARPGHSITLTINQSLQEIAERELAEGIARTGSSGGDVVIMDPRDGAVLAMAGIRGGKPAPSATAMTEPYEPGSVMKPFVVSRALQLQRVRPDEVINTEGGVWVIGKRRITDEHKAASMTVRDIIRLSSNIGAAKIAETLSEREEFEALRDFGFGTPTGVPYPAESRGQLPAPKWRPQTAASVAMGYAMSATALQIAAAYVAIANDGELLQPAMVREVRDPNGAVVFTHTRTALRRVVDPATAKLMRTMLESVVDSGTAVAAELATYDVAGKSGTARRASGGRYDGLSYNSTFAGMFPAQAPQYVLVVRLIDPKGKIFGGTVAGRVVNVILQGALATRDASLDRRALAAVSKPLPMPKAKPLTPEAIVAAQRDTARFDSLRAPAPPAAAPLAPPAHIVVSLPFKPSSARSRGARPIVDSGAGILDDARGDLRAVPSVYGLDARQAVRALHAAGFHVSLASGSPGRTRPAAGVLARSGAVVVLETGK
jgi:cell division protein FtsI (penicillin-binding protein 3)